MTKYQVSIENVNNNLFQLQITSNGAILAQVNGTYTQDMGAQVDINAFREFISDDDDLRCNLISKSKKLIQEYVNKNFFN